MSTTAPGPVTLNHPGNSSIDPRTLVTPPVPETVIARWSYGVIAFVSEGTNEPSRTKAPPAFTLSAYAWWLPSFANFRPPYEGEASAPLGGRKSTRPKYRPTQTS